MDSSKIEQLNQFLKSRFFGINKPIDEICDKIKAWYYVPEAMTRPQIINLWGQTGTGKTSLVREISEFLEKDLIQIDLGEYVGDSTKNLGHNFFEKYYSCSKKSTIILIDEFHIARTKESSGAEIDRKSLRSLWHLLSDGLLYLDESSMHESVDWTSYLIEDCMEDFHKAIKYISNYNEHNEHKKENNKNYISPDVPVSEGKKEDEYEYYKKRIDQPSKFFPRHLLAVLCRALDYNSTKELIKMLNDNFIKTCSTLQDKLENIKVQPKLDFTKSLIFVSGNLDNLYIGSDNFDPDIDLEILAKKAEDITISDVKKELTNRFRLEQIGRLGNNHIIYPVLSKESYYKIIEKDLNRLKSFYLEKHKINLTFNESVIEIIYKEGVFPNQGARSVLSTVSTFIESALANFYLDYKKYGQDVSDIQISFKDKSFVFEYSSQITKVPAILKIDELRKPDINQRSVISAVHEAGHIVSSVLKLGIIPNRASIFTATSENGGIVELLYSESKKECDTFESIRNYIVMAISGSVAEKIVYKKEFAGCGSYSDLRKATMSAISLLTHYGYHDLTTKTRSGDLFHTSILRTEKDEECVKKIINECTKIAENVIKKNTCFLKKIADCLLSRTTVKKEDILEIMNSCKIICVKKTDYVEIYKRLK